MPTFLTFIIEQIFSAFCFYPYRSHHTAATRRAITRIHIHVAPPKANGAMVCETIAFHFRSAVLANKVLDSTLEFSLICHF
ncbi:MAG: hypothetical protein UW19_C0014G0022 [Candidatus Moranbacteria bacterium GW2011_GWF2_44_10]|nr:MAG: hypothetical protein UW19_C0014G0022 [Candidatus Moranbacteria bacterium GW2011_GWF2_44_10]